MMNPSLEATRLSMDNPHPGLTYAASLGVGWPSIHRPRLADDGASVSYIKREDDLARPYHDREGVRTVWTRLSLGRYLINQCNASQLDTKKAVEWFTASKEVAVLKVLDNDAPIWANNQPGLMSLWRELYASIEVDYSCMRGNRATAAYGVPGNGLKLAWLENSTGDKFGRSIIHAGGFLRCYPCAKHEMSIASLEAIIVDRLGVDRGNSIPEGVLLAVIHDDDGGGYCLPYIDGDRARVDFCGSFFKVTRHGELDCKEAGGVVYIGTPCDCCGELTDEEHLYYIDQAEIAICQRCLNNNYVSAVYDGRGNEAYCDKEYAIVCESDGLYYFLDATSLNDIYQCEETSDYFHIDDLVTIDGFFYWSSLISINRLDHEHNDDVYAFAFNTVTLSDGTTAHLDDAEDIEADIEARLSNRGGDTAKI